MTEEILKITKIIFLVQTIVGIVFGLFFLFGAEIYLDLYSWPYEEPVFSRLLGMDFLGTASLLLLSYRETKWEKVKNVVIYDIIWTVLNSIGFIVLQFTFELPLINWSNIAFYILFAVLYCYIYIQQQK
jgi:hypothetical protein